MAADYPWFAVVNKADSLQQGDFLLDCAAPVEPLLIDAEHPEDEQIEVETVLYARVVVLSHSCDIENVKTGKVIVCPAEDVSIFLGTLGGRTKQSDAKSKLIAGRYVGHHLLNPCSIEHYVVPHLVVHFADSFSIPLTYAQALIEAQPQRIRLLPPYREHLAQAFARFYMRVALPVAYEPIP